MGIKICLDAGHYGKANQSPAVKSYYESEMTWKLHMMLKEQLERYGIEVKLTRSNQATDLGLEARGKASAGCDLFLSIHSNAVGNAVNESVDRPVVIVQLDGKGDALGNKLAALIRKVMGTKQKEQVFNKKGNRGEYYGVLRGAAAVGTVGMIVEHSFHTCTSATKWLMNDSNLQKLAEEEAKLIAEHFGIQKPVEKQDVLYCVQVGAFENKANAEALLKKVEAAGFNAIIAEKQRTDATPEPAKKSVDEVAREVIAGKWGAGAERKQRLTDEFGADFAAAVQKRVNELMKG